MSSGEISKTSSAIQPKISSTGVQSFYDPFMLQSQQSMCVYPYSNTPTTPVTLYQDTNAINLSVQKCPQVFTFSPQGGSVPWQGAYSGASAQEVVLTPTTLPQTFLNQGVIAAGTPEFIHPRNTNIPQWLMSPPVVDSDPSIVSYVPLNTSSPTVVPSVSKTLMTPDDFRLPTETDLSLTHKPQNKTNDGEEFVTESTSVISRTCSDSPETDNNEQDSVPAQPELDSGIESPKWCSHKSHLCQTEAHLKNLFLFSKSCDDFEEFQAKMHENYSHCVGCTLLTFLLTSTFSPNHTTLDHSLLLKKLGTNFSAESSAEPKTEKQNMFPIGVFWDIENCAVPNGKSASSIVNKIREKFFYDHAEAEFMAVCDINKECKHVVQDLNNAQVNVIHVNATAKNAADDKLRQSIRRYAQTHTAPATVILITGDCNFTSEVSDLRHRHKYFVVLIHPSNSSDTLIQAANTAISYEEFVSDLPIVYDTREQNYAMANTESQLLVTNLPTNVDTNAIRSRLKQISDNCGGKVIKVYPPTAIIKFSNDELARRSLKRLNGETVLGSKIIVMRKTSDLSAFSKHFTPRSRGHQGHFDGRHNHTPTRPRRYDGNQCDQGAAPQNYKDASGVQLTISNIDSKLGVKAIQEAVWNMITEHTPIWKLQIRPHNRFTVMCDVTVPDVIAASCVLQHLHRRKIGSKRVLVTITQRNNEDIDKLKKELLPILKEFGSEGIHFKELMSLYNQSYHKRIKFNHLRQLQDFIALDERPDGVYVMLNRTLDRPTYALCQMHFRPERSSPDVFIKIDIGLREFSAKLHALLHSHNGTVYLYGFEQCYQAEFGLFPYPQDLDSGVYLEHQISYVPGVQILQEGPKMVVWSQPHSDAGSDTASDVSTSSRSKTSNVVSFSREIVELLKAHPYCCVPINEFRSAYQIHFGHAPRCVQLPDVTELLSTMPHVVQVMGMMPNQLVTLTHRSQVKRFTHEIIKILKASPDKAILMAQLPDMYLKTFGRSWNLRDYGVSVLSDILDDIPDGNICVSGEGDNIVLSLPSRERTSEEVERTNQFSRELIEILKSRHRCRMSFTEFVPAYHRQFGRQCKLSNYGFSKLVDLFESLPHVVQVVDGAEKYLQLTEDEQLKVLTSQIIGLLRHADGESVQMPLGRVQTAFSHKYGFPLVPHHYSCENIESLIRRLAHAVKIVHDVDGTLMIKQAERKPIRLLCAQLLVLLLDLNIDLVELDQLHQAYRDRYNEDISPGEYGFLSLLDVLKKAISGVAKLETNDHETVISLKPIYQRAKRIRSILLQHGGSMSLGEFNRAYRARYRESLDAERHGFRSGEAMLRALSMILMVKGFGIKKVVVLRNHMQHLLYPDGPLSSSVSVCSEVHPTKPALTSGTPPSGLPKPRPLQEIIANCASPRKAQKLDSSFPATKPGGSGGHDDSYRPYQPDKFLDDGPNSGISPHGFSAPAAREFPAPGNRGAVGSDPFYVFEPSAEQYHQYQSSCDGLRHRDVGKDYVMPNSGQYFQFKEGSYQSPLTSYAPFGSGGARKATDKGPASLQDIFQQSSDSQHGRRRFSLSVITLPTGTTSISSTPSPDSALSTDEDGKLSSDDSRLREHNNQATPSPLRLAASFPTPTTL
uniref:Meiosis regulator and mRNA stability factor 1 n=1 Tax=Phallusia mammillata TaxID=59560 RepID=A0A6F9DKT8_9ASCI|nr:meiosis arrest female protein 1 homolog [Phallusia mammillata]